MAIAATFGQPGVAAGGVRQYQVDHHLQAQFVGTTDQGIEVGQGAELRIDVAVVGDVIAEVGYGRAHEGRDPDGVDAEVGHVGQAAGDAGEIADAIAVAVLEGARIDLVDHRATPPVAVDGLGLTIGHGDYPFTPPAVRPATILRWKTSTRTISGRVTTTEAAMMVPQGVSISEAPESSAMATGTVRVSLLATKVRAKRNSF